jgi:hypothetical protein
MRAANASNYLARARRRTSSGIPDVWSPEPGLWRRLAQARQSSRLLPQRCSRALTGVIE